MKKPVFVLAVLYLLCLLTGCAEPKNESIVSVPSAVEHSLEATAQSAPGNGEEPSESASNSSSAQTNVPSETASSAPEASSGSTEPAPNPEFSYNSYALYCVDDEAFVCSENIDESIAPASLTKLLTASVALHYVSTDEVFTVGSERDLVHSGSSLCLILKGHRLKLYDLITGMLMVSGNDAAYTVAVCTAKTVSGDSSMSDTDAVNYFCGLMNDFAQELGMTNSHFTTPDGWDDPEQYTTVRDLTILAEYALSVPEIREIAATHQKYVVFDSGENITWTNTNKLLDPESEFYCENAIGLKTGSTRKAGCCLIAAFLSGGKEYISVVTGCDTDRDRYDVTIDRWQENDDF